MRAFSNLAGGVVAAGIAGVVALGAFAAEPEVVFEQDGDPVYRLLAPGQIPAIHDPVILEGSAADDQMRPDEPVLGLVVGGEARAYSLWHLDVHEIVNDTLGGKPIAVTW